MLSIKWDSCQFKTPLFSVILLNYALELNLMKKLKLSPFKILVSVWLNRILLTILVLLPNPEPLTSLKPLKEDHSILLVNLVLVSIPLSWPLLKFKSFLNMLMMNNGSGNPLLLTLSILKLIPAVNLLLEDLKSFSILNKMLMNLLKKIKLENLSINIQNLSISLFIWELPKKLKKKFLLKMMNLPLKLKKLKMMKTLNLKMILKSLTLIVNHKNLKLKL